MVDVDLDPYQRIRNVLSGEEQSSLIACLCVPARPELVRHVRGFIRNALATASVGPDVSYAVQLVVSELVSNVVRHNVAAFDPVAMILLNRGGAVLRVAVHDSDPIGGEASAPDENSESGRGLLVVTGIADRWGVYPTAVGKSTWCEFAAWPDETIALGS